MSLLKLYAACLFIFCSIDFLWVGLIAKKWYSREIGYLLVDSIHWLPVVGFYMLYAVGILIFVVFPALQLGSGTYALFYGAFLGLITYAAYDLTNLATLKNWPILLAVCDMLWGSFVTGITSVIVYYLKQRLME